MRGCYRVGGSESVGAASMYAGDSMRIERKILYEGEILYSMLLDTISEKTNN